MLQCFYNKTIIIIIIEDGSIGFLSHPPIPQDDKPMPYFYPGRWCLWNKGPSWWCHMVTGNLQWGREDLQLQHLQGPTWVVENAFGKSWPRDGKSLLTTMQPRPSIIEMLCLPANNLMRIRYPALHNGMVDEEDDQPQCWCQEPGDNLLSLKICSMFCRRKTETPRLERGSGRFLKHHFNNPVGAVPWQNRDDWWIRDWYDDGHMTYVHWICCLCQWFCYH